MTVLSPRVLSFCCLEGLKDQAMAWRKCSPQKDFSGVQNWRLGRLGPTEVLESWLWGSCLKSLSLRRGQGHHSQHGKPFSHMLSSRSPCSPFSLASPELAEFHRGHSRAFAIPTFKFPSLPSVASAQTEQGSFMNNLTPSSHSASMATMYKEEPSVRNTSRPLLPKEDPEYLPTTHGPYIVSWVSSSK